MKKYKHLFFDLDRTLWDFDTNNLLTFKNLYTHFKLQQRGIPDFDIFLSEYKHINIKLWDAYKRQEITKENLNFFRFYDSILPYNIKDEQLARDMGEYYILHSPRQTALYPGTIEVLEALHKKYQMHIITNGFEEVQYIKLEKSGLRKYFEHIITSEKAGFKKPDKRIFEFALNHTGADTRESIIIGDDLEADIFGAQQAGMDQIWVMHQPISIEIAEPTYSVSRLIDIMNIL